ncbi:cytochrome c3 family protein [Acidobacteriota bacterium]
MKGYLMSLCRTLFIIIFIVAGGALLIGYDSAQDTAEQQTPPVIQSPSSIGDVSFPHLFHIEDLEQECQTCHHETNASELKMPHEDYFNDFWINCRTCHRSDGSAVLEPQTCSSCHHDSPVSIADETLSAKVVIHQKCWECHEVEKGENASQSCATCHKKDPGEGSGTPVSGGHSGRGGIK